MAGKRTMLRSGTDAEEEEEGGDALRLIVFLLLIAAAFAGSGGNITRKGNVADLNVTEVIDTNALLTWTTEKRIKSYKVKVLNSSKATVYSVVVDGKENYHDITGLEPDTDYRGSILAIGPGVGGSATEYRFKTKQSGLGIPTYEVQIAPASRNYSDQVELKWTSTKRSGGGYIRSYKIWFREQGQSCDYAIDYAERWRTAYNISLLPPNMTFEINIAVQGVLESDLGPVKKIIRSTIEAKVGEELDDEGEELQKEEDEEMTAKSFYIDVSGTWSDVIRINFDPKYVEKLDITRVYSDGNSEFVVSLRHASYYDTGISVLRALSFYRSCYNYKVHLTITTARSKVLTEDSDDICTGPGSPAAEQVKFWIFTSLLAILMVAIFAIALRHELRREAYLIGDKMTLQNVGTAALSREMSREMIRGYRSAEWDANRSRSSKGPPMIVPLSYADHRKGGKA